MISIDQGGLVLRAADPSEYAEVGRVRVASYQQYVEDFGERWPRVVARLEIIDPSPEEVLLVAEFEGTIAGTVSVHRESDPERTSWPKEWSVLRRLAVHPESRRRGVGRHLVSACVDRARVWAAPALALRTMEFMVPARAMYERLGFRYLNEFSEPPMLSMSRDLGSF